MRRFLQGSCNTWGHLFLHLPLQRIKKTPRNRWWTCKNQQQECLYSPFVTTTFVNSKNPRKKKNCRTNQHYTIMKYPYLRPTGWVSYIRTFVNPKTKQVSSVNTKNFVFRSPFYPKDHEWYKFTFLAQKVQIKSRVFFIDKYFDSSPTSLFRYAPSKPHLFHFICKGGRKNKPLSIQGHNERRDFTHQELRVDRGYLG